MPSLTRRRTQSLAPEPSQVAAVRRALDAGDPARARLRLATLRKSFPEFKPLLGLAWEVEDRDGSAIIAAARAYEWQRASPNSRAAAEALSDSAFEAGLLAIHRRADERLLAIDGRSDPTPWSPVIGATGPMTLEQAEAVDLSRMHLADNDPAAALAATKDVDHLSARNNRALALFCLGDMAQACATAEANWQADAADLFALERLLRWRCWAEGLASSLGLLPTLVHTPARRPEDAIARVGALRFLGDAAAARLAWDDANGESFWDSAAYDQRQLFDEVGEFSNELPGGPSTWFPGPWIHAFTELVRAHKRDGAAAHQAGETVLLDACDAHVDYLDRAVELGHAAVRHLALAVLKRRVQRADTAAQATLQSLLRRPCGPDAERIQLMAWLAEGGLGQPDDRCEVWLAGRLRTVRSRGLTITSEPRPSPFPPEGTALNERMHQAIGRDALDEALNLALQLHGMYPNEPSTLTNLAAIKEGLDHPADEVVELYRQAHALAPDYLFARCGLARYLAQEGLLDEAGAMIDVLLDRDELHHSEYRSFLLSQHALAEARGEYEAMRAVERSLDELMDWSA